MMKGKMDWMVVLLVVFIGKSLLAQPDTLWTRTYGDTAFETSYCVQQTMDNGFIMLGRTESYGAGDCDFWLIRTDASGDTLWTKTFGGTEYEDGKYVQQTSDGGFILAGHVQSTGAGSNDVWLIKTDASGDTLWTKTYGGSESDVSYNIHQLSDNGYIILANTYTYGAGGSDFWLIRTDASGDTLWTRIYGNSDTDFGHSLQETTDNGFILAGHTVSFGAGGNDGWLIKTDASGDTLWTKTYGGTEDEILWDVQQTTDGGYILTGFTKSYGAGLDDLWLVKTDASGDTLWMRTFGGNEDDRGMFVRQTTDGGYIVAGYTQSFSVGFDDLWILRTDASGDTLWTKIFGGSESDRGQCVQQTTDGGYVITGYTKSYGHGDGDVWLIRLAPEESTRIGEMKIHNPVSYRLLQNYPNPFNPSTKIEYIVKEPCQVNLVVYNLTGQVVKELVNSYQLLGPYSITLNMQEIPSGIYFYKILMGSFQETKKMVKIE